MKSETKKHILSVSISKADMDKFIQNYCKQFIPDEPINNQRIVTSGPRFDIHEVSYTVEYDAILSGTVRIAKQMFVYIDSSTVLEIVRQNSVKELELHQEPGINWDMNKISWDWENGSFGPDIILTFELEKVSEKNN